MAITRAELDAERAEVTRVTKDNIRLIAELRHEKANRQKDQKIFFFAMAITAALCLVLGRYVFQPQQQQQQMPVTAAPEMPAFLNGASETEEHVSDEWRLSSKICELQTEIASLDRHQPPLTFYELTCVATLPLPADNEKAKAMILDSFNTCPAFQAIRDAAGGGPQGLGRLGRGLGLGLGLGDDDENENNSGGGASAGGWSLPGVLPALKHKTQLAVKVVHCLVDVRCRAEYEARFLLRLKGDRAWERVKKGIRQRIGADDGAGKKKKDEGAFARGVWVQGVCADIMNKKKKQQQQQ